MNKWYKLMVILMGVSSTCYATPDKLSQQYQGERISVEFQDMPVRTVIDLLAHTGGANIVASDGVTGNITLRLNNIPWDQVLDIVIDTKHLIKSINNDVITISSADELAQISQKHTKARIQSEQHIPLQTEYIRINYADAKDVLSLINHKTDGMIGSAMLSERGVANMDARTNTLIVKDIKPNIDDILTLISRLDVPVRQVMIEARIVSANDGFSRDLGVSFGVLSNSDRLQIGGSHNTLQQLRMSNDGRINNAGPNHLSVDLGVANPAGRIAFGLINISDVLLDLELSAMQADRQGKVISTPKVLTADKQTARISSGMQIAYQEETSSGATNVVFKEAALALEVTPIIAPDGKIILKLKVKNGTPVTNLGEIAIQEDALETNVVVDDGQTVVLGGIYRQTNNEGVAKVPFFGNLPILGKLFRKESHGDTKEELLIFVTPKLVQ